MNKLNNFYKPSYDKEINEKIDKAINGINTLFIDKTHQFEEIINKVNGVNVLIQEVEDLKTEIQNLKSQIEELKNKN